VLSSRWHVEYIPKKHIVDLLKNPRIVFFHRYRKHIHLAYASIIALLGGINLFIIFVFMPFILSWVGFGLLNWLAHRSGTPADIPILNIIAPGEGWHKYHHDNPRSYKLHKLDIAGILIERFFIKPKFSSKD
jgi:fatty-acid desaturase